MLEEINKLHKQIDVIRASKDRKNAFLGRLYHYAERLYLSAYCSETNLRIFLAHDDLDAKKREEIGDIAKSLREALKLIWGEKPNDGQTTAVAPGEVAGYAKGAEGTLAPGATSREAADRGRLPGNES